MKIALKLLVVFLLINTSVKAQKSNDTIKLKEVSIASNRISLPFSKTSRSITLITSNDIVNSSATNVADLLQNVVGVDVRRRGVDGMQSDLYIRGGNFDQTLILIDGVKMDDVQTGHHSMNAILSLENIERIEIIKGSAARIYGQNAFTGAINIVTKDVIKNALDVSLNYGSYENKKGTVSVNEKFAGGSLLASVNYQKSDGYRFNTDFQNVASFIKTTYKKYNFVASFAQRKFGANGFYASPNFKDQYEETQTSLVTLGTTYSSEKVTVKPRMYWRRNQDMYLFLRQDPLYYRNLHVSNKIGGEINVVVNSNLGKTGVGLDISRTFLISNNLGNHNRTAVTGFFEQRFQVLDGKLDITPGVAISYYSDFGTKSFPGIEIGYRLSDVTKVYANSGYTYRVPTFTDMFYVGPTTQGNPNLKPESAFSNEIGIKMNPTNFAIDFVVFNRNSNNLIDWNKDTEVDKWEARNFSQVNTLGFETNLTYNFDINNYTQSFNIGYSFIDDDIKDNNVQYTRYSLNSIKHQFNSSIDFKLNSIFNQNIAYRYVERTNGENYTVVDAKLLATLKSGVELSIVANNIFNTEYTETNLVPMPKGNVMFGFKYSIY